MKWVVFAFLMSVLSFTGNIDAATHSLSSTWDGTILRITLHGTNDSEDFDVSGTVGDWLYFWENNESELTYIDTAGATLVVVTVELKQGTDKIEYLSISSAAHLHPSFDVDATYCTQAIISTGKQADNIYGSPGSDVIFTFDNVDNIWGFEGSDYIFSGPGVDWVFGGGGVDVLNQGGANDNRDSIESWSNPN